MILADDWLPLNESERRAIGYLTRYHRGAVPEVGFDEILTGFGEPPPDAAGPGHSSRR